MDEAIQEIFGFLPGLARMTGNADFAGTEQTGFEILKIAAAVEFPDKAVYLSLLFFNCFHGNNPKVHALSQQSHLPEKTNKPVFAHSAYIYKTRGG